MACSSTVRAEFERDGCVIVRGVVAPDEVAAMTDVFLALIPEVAYPPGADGRVIREIPGAANAYPPLAQIARDPRFGALMAEALGAARVQLLQDTLLYKPAIHGGVVEWHQDYTYLGYLVPAHAATLRIALLPEDVENGCMRVVDGSHRWGPLGDNQAFRATSVDSLIPSLSPEQRDQIENARALVLGPGDVSIHSCLTLHGSVANPSPRPRRTIILRMFDAECRLDRARLPPGAETYFPTDADGHLDASAFPYVYGSAP